MEINKNFKSKANDKYDCNSMKTIYVKNCVEKLKNVELKKIKKIINIKNENEIMEVYEYFCYEIGKGLKNIIIDESDYMNIVQEINCILSNVLSKIASV